MKHLVLIALLTLAACGGGNDECTGCTDENGHVPPPTQLPCQKDGSCL